MGCKRLIPNQKQDELWPKRNFFGACSHLELLFCKRFFNDLKHTCIWPLLCKAGGDLALRSVRLLLKQSPSKARSLTRQL